MNFLLFLYLIFGSFNTDNGAPEISDLKTSRTMLDSAVQVKSTLNPTLDKVLIDIQLPYESEVGFEIYNGQGAIQHLWHSQSLHSGRHQLALKLPSLNSGKYVLHIKVDNQLYKHLVFLPKS